MRSRKSPRAYVRSLLSRPRTQAIEQTKKKAKTWKKCSKGRKGDSNTTSWAMLHAAPNPTTRGVGTVPLRSPRSCPPPLICASIRTLGRLRMYSAPTPFGPYSLCPLNDMRSIFMASTSMGILPAAWRDKDGLIALDMLKERKCFVQGDSTGTCRVPLKRRLCLKCGVA